MIRMRGSEEKYEKTWEEFVSYLTRSSSRLDVGKFLHSLLSKRERFILAKRLKILFMLKEGYSIEAIWKELRTSRNVVRAVRRSFQSGLGYMSWRENQRSSRKTPNHNHPMASFNRKDFIDLLNTLFHSKTVRTKSRRKKG